MNPELAVILAVHSGDSPVYFKEALESIRLQSCSGFLTLIVLDGPVNEEIESLIESFPCEQHLIRFSVNQGLAAALNAAIAYCRKEGIEFIARMDADDRMRKGRLQHQLEFLKANPDVDILGGSIIEIDEEGKERGKMIIYPENHQKCLAFFRFRDPVAHPAVMFRSRFFEKAGIYNEQMRKNQDTELWYRGFLSGCRFANIPEVLLEFRMTRDFFDSRRSGRVRAKQLFLLRRKINRGLQFGLKAQLFAMAGFLLTVSPSWLRRWAYKALR